MSNETQNTIQLKADVVYEDFELVRTKNKKKIRKTKIKHKLLIEYFTQRGIPLALAQLYLHQVKILDKRDGKIFAVIGIENDENGYEVRSLRVNGCIGQKDVLFIRGAKPRKKVIHVFMDIMDYLTQLRVQKRRFHGDCLILFSLSQISKVETYVQTNEYHSGYTWLENDMAGQHATKELDEVFNKLGIIHKPQNHLYKSFLNLNDHLIHVMKKMQA